MILYLVRHGETAHNRDGVGLGRDDVPLTPKGIAQARAVAARIAHGQPEIVLASPLQRAMDTAHAICAKTAQVVRSDERLIELAVGETEGLPFNVVRERFPAFLTQWVGPDGHTARLPGGESILDVHQRVCAFLESLRELDLERIVVVAHNFVLRVLLCELLGIGPSRFRQVTTDLASLSVAEVSPQRTSVLRLNDTCHLRGLDS